MGTNKRWAALLVAALATLTVGASPAAAKPPEIVKLADEGSMSFNPPELSCLYLDASYTWGVQSTIIETAGVAITHDKRDGTTTFRFTGYTIVRVEAASDLNKSLGGPQIDLRLAGNTRIVVGPNTTGFTFDYAGKTLLGGAYVTGRATVTFDSTFTLTGFHFTPNVRSLCNDLAP